MLGESVLLPDKNVNDPNRNEYVGASDSMEMPIVSLKGLNVSLDREMDGNFSPSVGEVLANFAQLESTKTSFSLSGRILRLRKMRNYWFADIFQEGHQIQLVGQTSRLLSAPPLFSLVELTGRAVYTKTGQKSVDVLDWQKQCKGLPKASRDYLGEQNCSYEQLYAQEVSSARTLGAVRDFFGIHGFHEVLTPLILDSFNGGHSFPVSVVVNEKQIGFVRTTLEERMLALLGLGMERIYQIGGVARSFNEAVFLEAYAARVSFEQGMNLIQNLLASVAQQATDIDESTLAIREMRWESKRFTDVMTEVFDDGARLQTGADLSRALVEHGIAKKHYSPETATDVLANFYGSKISAPLFITHLPAWSSPLYAVDPQSEGGRFLLRGRGYLPQQEGGFDFGIQEIDPDMLKSRIALQRKLSGGDTSASEVSNFAVSVLERGLPSVFGIGISFPRLIKLIQCPSPPKLT